uniref:Uncharacterized protein n=2 Tax=Clytia hemisphaerica TaxID=252671 RepID=A0A7M5XFV0_9CNID
MRVTDNSSSVEVSMTTTLTADGIDQESQITGDSSTMDVRNNGSISFDSMDKDPRTSGSLAAIDAGDISSVCDIVIGKETSGDSLPVQIKPNAFVGNEDNECSKDLLAKKEIGEEIANANSSIIVDDGQLPCFSGYIKPIKNVDDADNVGKLTQASTDDGNSDSTALETSDGSQITTTPGQYDPNEAPAENLNSKLEDLNCDDHIDPSSTISDGNLGKNVSGNDSNHNNGKVKVGGGWKNLKVDKSGLIDLIFAIVGLLLVLTIFLIAQRTHVPPTVKSDQSPGFPKSLFNGLRCIQSGVEQYANPAQLTEPFLTGLNKVKEYPYSAFHRLRLSIGIAQLGALVQPLSNGIEHIQKGVEGLYVIAIGFITPPPKTLWNRVTDMLSYVTLKKEQPRGYGIENTLFYMWQSEPPKTTNNENLMIYVLCYVVLLVTFLVVREPLGNLAKRFGYGYFKNIGGYLSKGKWFLLIIGVMVGVVALVVYFNADMISA